MSKWEYNPGEFKWEYNPGDENTYCYIITELRWAVGYIEENARDYSAFVMEENNPKADLSGWLHIGDYIESLDAMKAVEEYKS